jgi:hypothetical protein
MRRIDIVLLAVSAVIVLLVGFLPLITAEENPADRIRRECQFFYGNAGPEAVRHCQSEMMARGADTSGR